MDGGRRDAARAQALRLRAEGWEFLEEAGMLWSSFPPELRTEGPNRDESGWYYHPEETRYWLRSPFPGTTVLDIFHMVLKRMRHRPELYLSQALRQVLEMESEAVQAEVVLERLAA